jgi:hypothetical protein
VLLLHFQLNLLKPVPRRRVIIRVRHRLPSRN